MQIRVIPIGLIRRFVSEAEITLPDGVTPRQLIGLLRIPGELKMVAIVNGKSRDLDQSLEDRDEVKLVTVITGG